MFRFDRILTLCFFHCLPKQRMASESRIPILMYHSISDDPETGISSYYRLATAPERFRQHMRCLKEQGYAVIGLAEALHRIETKAAFPERCAVLTFDDGFHDFLIHAWPVLRDFRQTATVFLPTAFIGGCRKSFKGRECLTWPEVRELRNHCVTFGSHTASHPKLYVLQWKDIRRELLESRLRIEDELQAPVAGFAYPYAFPQENRAFVQRFAKELVDQGYRAAVTTVIGRAGLRSDPLRLERLPVNGSDDVPMFKAKLAGCYDWMAGPQALARRIKLSLRRTCPVDAE